MKTSSDQEADQLDLFEPENSSEFRGEDIDQFELPFPERDD